MATITDYELFHVPPRWLFLRIETSDGLVGWGEPVVEGRARTVETAVEELFESYLLGEDPTRIEDHWQAMYRGGFYRGGPVLMSAIAGIDQALWDIKGKQLGAPVHELLGGPARDRVRIYEGCGGDTPEEIRESARHLVEEHGMTALKTGINTGATYRVEPPAVVEDVREYFRAFREGAGPDVDVAIDFHGKIHKPLAGRLFDAIEEFEPFFVEEPVLAEHNDALPAIAGRTAAPIATGERMYSRWEFKDLLEDQHIDIVQPDLSHAGGITEVQKIASMAAAYDVALAPHCPLGPIAFAACLQIDVNCPNALVQEQGVRPYDPDADQGLEYLANDRPFDYEDGFVAAPTDPGLGIEVDETVVRERADPVDWHNDILRTDDGSVAEW